VRASNLGAQASAKLYMRLGYDIKNIFGIEHGVVTYGVGGIASRWSNGNRLLGLALAYCESNFAVPSCSGNSKVND
jgi:hypothetical protein